MPLLPAAFSRHVLTPFALYFRTTTASDAAADVSIEPVLHRTLACIRGAWWVSRGKVNHSVPRIMCWVSGRKVNHFVRRICRVFPGEINHSVRSVQGAELRRLAEARPVAVGWCFGAALAAAHPLRLPSSTTISGGAACPRPFTKDGGPAGRRLLFVTFSMPFSACLEQN